MPVVTDIKKQRRSEVRFSVCLDGSYAFALSDLELSTTGLRVGQVLSEEEAARYRGQAEEGGVYALSLRFVGVRPRSRREVADYLRRKGKSAEAAGKAIMRLERAGLLDDRQFAASWVANRQLLRPRSRRRLEQELLAKGVSRADIATALQEFGSENELEALVQLVERKRRLSQYRDATRLAAYLARQGYGYGLIKRVLDPGEEWP